VSQGRTNRKEFTHGIQATSKAPRDDRRSGYRCGTAAAPPPAKPADELERVAKLHASGVLTDEEFAAAKAKIIGAA
jgi:hypothetical protein